MRPLSKKGHALPLFSSCELLGRGPASFSPHLALRSMVGYENAAGRRAFPRQIGARLLATLAGDDGKSYGLRQAHNRICHAGAVEFGSRYLPGVLVRPAQVSRGGAPAATPPSISNLSYSPTMLGETSGTITVNGSIDFNDSGGDLATVTLAVADPSGKQLSSNTSPIQGAAGVTSGTIAGSVQITAAGVVIYTIKVSVTDSGGSHSNTLSGPFQIVAVASQAALVARDRRFSRVAHGKRHSRVLVAKRGRRAAERTRRRRKSEHAGHENGQPRRRDFRGDRRHLAGRPRWRARHLHPRDPKPVLEADHGGWRNDRAHERPWLRGRDDGYHRDWRRGVLG